MSAPLFELLGTMKDRQSFHMPGHKGSQTWDCFNISMDVTELDVSDDLYHAQGAIAQAQQLMARRARAENTIFLTNGSTCGVEAMLLYAAQPGEKVILPRAAHLSAVSACALGGLEPAWVDAYADDGGAPFTRESDILAAIEANPDAKCVLVTRPDYFGRLMPLEKVCAAAHSAGMLMLVDEAHGAHLNWLGQGAIYRRAGLECGKMAMSAMDAGADICVQSAHKTLPALTGSAMLHMRSGIDRERLLRCVSLLQSSSPSFLIMASIDKAREFMDERDERDMYRLCGMIDLLYAAGARMEGYVPARDYFDVPCDRTRVVLDVSARGLTGYDVQKRLTEAGIDIEMADKRRIVLITTLVDGPADFGRVQRQLAVMPRRLRKFSPPKESVVPRGERVTDIRAAMLGKTARVPLEQAAGRVAARATGIYPPGVPLCVPGECITAEIADMLIKAQTGGANLFGIEDGMCVVTAE